MVTLAQVTAGIERYLDTEILAKIPGWQKWVLGAAASRMLSRSGEIFNTLKNNPVVSAMGVIDDQDQIDIAANSRRKHSAEQSLLTCRSSAP